MSKNFYLIALMSVFALCSCSDADTKEESLGATAVQTATVNTEVKLLDRLPATCKVDNSDHLGFCLPGDTLIYRPDPKKKDQKDALDVIGDFCAQEKPIILVVEDDTSARLLVCEVLRRADVEVSFGKEVPNIINRAGTDICPVEKLTGGVESPDEAYLMIKGFLKDKNL